MTLRRERVGPGLRRRSVAVRAWLVVGPLLVVVVGWLALTRWDPLLHGSPVTLLLGVAGLVAGIVATALAVAAARSGRRPGGRHRLVRSVALVVSLVVGVLLAASLVYARPLPASATAVAAMRSSPTVRVQDRLTWYELVPTRTDVDGAPVVPTRALVFAPGAKVDPRAYAPLLRPLAEQGVLVAVLKPPLGLAVVQPDQARSVLDAHPQVKQWTAAGHSLGGAMITSFADRHAEVGALVLWASYGTVTRTDLPVLSVSGGADGVLTPAELAEHRADLPASTRSVVVAGAVHAYFGDYGVQRGDGTATVGRTAAQAQIVAATLAFVTRPPVAPR